LFVKGIGGGFVVPHVVGVVAGPPLVHVLTGPVDDLLHGRLGPPEELPDLRTNTARSTGAGVSSTTSSAVWGPV
jgi:hypothetical protein